MKAHKVKDKLARRRHSYDDSVKAMVASHQKPQGYRRPGSLSGRK